MLVRSATIDPAPARRWRSLGSSPQLIRGRRRCARVAVAALLLVLVWALPASAHTRGSVLVWHQPTAPSTSHIVIADADGRHARALTDPGDGQRRRARHLPERSIRAV